MRHTLVLVLLLSAVGLGGAADLAERDKNYQTAAGLIKAGNLAAAGVLLEAAAKDNPASLLVAYARGYVAEKSGQRDETLEHYRYALAIYYALPRPDEADTRTADTVRARLKELAPGTTQVLATADEVAAKARTFKGEERRLAEAAALDLRHLAVGEPADTPPGLAPAAPAVPAESPVERTLGYRLSGAVRTKDHPDAREFNGHWYKVIPERLTWTAAAKRCQELGGYPATVTSRAENDLVARLAGQRFVWLGATDQRKEGTWLWITGEPFGFADWFERQPDNGGGQEHFLGYWGDRRWNDFAERDASVTGFVCEWER